MTNAAKGFSHHFDVQGRTIVVHWGPQVQDNYVFLKGADDLEMTLPVVPAGAGRAAARGLLADPSLEMYTLDMRPESTEPRLAPLLPADPAQGPGLWKQIKVFVAAQIKREKTPAPGPVDQFITPLDPGGTVQTFEQAR